MWYARLGVEHQMGLRLKRPGLLVQVCREKGYTGQATLNPPSSRRAGTAAWQAAVIRLRSSLEASAYAEATADKSP